MRTWFRVAGLAVAGTLASVQGAAAGDAAARRVLGFSPDGRYFAFEQYSMIYDNDGAFSEFVVIDTTTDRLVGQPIKVVVRGDEGLDETKARTDAETKARPVVAKLRIGEPGTLVAGKPSMALDEIGIYQMDPKPLAKTQGLALPDGRKLTFMIGEKPLGTALCDGAGGRATPGKVKVAGLRLTLAVDGAQPIVLQEDKALPKARRCASAYGIAEAYWHKAPDGTITLAALIELVDNHDYHAGPNRRFMVVTKRLFP